MSNEIKSYQCLICRSTGYDSFLESKDYFFTLETFRIVRCKSCGFLSTFPHPSMEEIHKYYKTEKYISHSDQLDQSLMTRLYHWVRNIMLNKKYRLISREFSMPGRILDIGSGTGYFIKYMQDRHWIAEGVEPDENARKYAFDKFNLRMIDPQEWLKDEELEYWDCITMWHVLEHVHSPDVYLEHIYKQLKHKGSLWIALPNPDSFDAGFWKEYWAAWDLPRHLWHFAPDKIIELAGNHGFALKAMHRLPFDLFYVSWLSGRYKKTLHPLYFLTASILGTISSSLNLLKTSSLIYHFKKL